MIGPFRLRHLSIDTDPEAVAYLPRYSAVWQPRDLPSVSRIQLRGNGSSVLATLNVIGQENLLAPDEIGVSDQAFALLGVTEGSFVEIEEANAPPSLEALRAKIRGGELSRRDIEQIIRDIASLRYSRMEIAAFLVACARSMSASEVLDLTQAMADAGCRLRWPSEMIVDIHSIGGTPGNRVSMIVVPIIAAHGLTIPKTSSRAITSPAGTADTMEVLARVDLGLDEVKRVVDAENGCLVWGGHANLSPADEILISVERSLNLDAPGQLAASILSKKLAAGITHLLLEIPVGPSAKVRDEASAARLRELFEYVAGNTGLVLDVMVTDGSTPIGRGIGPALEARDVMKVLRCAPDAPADLRERALAMAARVLEFDPALRRGRGFARARELLESGAALRKMENIIVAQGSQPDELSFGRLSFQVLADRSGTIEAIDCARISRLAILAGAPDEKGAGIDLLMKVGERVTAAAPLYRIHANVEADFRRACDEAATDSAYHIYER